MTKNCMYLNCIASTLIIIGGLNWGLVGLFGLDLVDLAFGAIPSIQRIIYILVGLGAVYKAFYAIQKCKTCNTGK